MPKSVFGAFFPMKQKLKLKITPQKPYHSIYIYVMYPNNLQPDLTPSLFDDILGGTWYT